MVVQKINFGSDFIPTGIVENPMMHLYVKYKEYGNPPIKLSVKKILGTEMYCIEYEGKFLLLEDYDPYLKFYKVYSKKDSNLLISPTSIPAKQIIYQEDELFFEGEDISEPRIRKIKGMPIFRSYNTYNLIQKYTVLKYDEKGEILRILFEVADGVYFWNNKRVDIVEKFIDDVYVTTRLDEYPKLEVESINLPGYTPIAYYPVSDEVRRARWLAIGLLLSFVLIIAILPIIVFRFFKNL